jgi:hypothetical protein
MSGLDWFFTVFFMALYLVLLFTLAVVTFRKGHWVIGIIGIFIPLLWIVGAVLPARRGTAYSMR